MINPVDFDLDIIQGSDYDRTFQVWQTKDKKAAADLSAFSGGQCQFRITEDDAETWYDSATSGTVTVDGAAGTVTLNIGAAVTGAFATYAGVYELKISTDAGVTYTVARGRVRVTRAIVR